MQAFLITPDTKSIESIEIQGLDDIRSRIGFDSIESDPVGADGDRLYFDEECFIRGTTGRFQIDSVIPVAGKGVLIGTTENGDTLQDVKISMEDLRHRTKFQ